MVQESCVDVGFCPYCLSRLHFIDFKGLEKGDFFSVLWCKNCYKFFKNTERLTAEGISSKVREIPATPELFEILYNSKTFQILEKDQTKKEKVRQWSQKK